MKVGFSLLRDKIILDLCGGTGSWSNPYKEAGYQVLVITFPERIVLEKPEGLIKFSLLKSKDIYPQYYGRLSRQERRAITPPGFAEAFFRSNP